MLDGELIGILGQWNRYEDLEVDNTLNNINKDD